MNVSDRIITVKENLPNEIEENSILSIVTSDVNSVTHGFHKYPAKFIPQIPRWAISKYLSGQKNKNVLDPFCGSGTTLVEAVLSNNNGIGIDVDPLSLLISKVKTTRVSEDLLIKILDWLLLNLDADYEVMFIPACKTLSHWFTEDAIRKLSNIRGLLDSIPKIFDDSTQVTDIQDLLYICFSSILRKASKADDQSQKTYVSHTKTKNPEDALILFRKQIVYFKERVIDFSKLTDDDINVVLKNTSSSKHFCEELSNFDIDLVVTSPPYIKAMDYIYNQMVELFWIGDLFDMQTQSKQNQKKSNYIGNKNITKKEYSDFVPTDNKIGIKDLDNALESIYLSDKMNGHKHSYITYRYYRDMENHFSEISRCLKTGVHYIMVVGNSKVSQIPINTSEHIVDLASRNGFQLSNRWSYVIKNHYLRFNRMGRGGKFEMDYVIDLIKK